MPVECWVYTDATIGVRWSLWLIVVEQLFRAIPVKEVAPRGKRGNELGCWRLRTDIKRSLVLDMDEGR